MKLGIAYNAFNCEELLYYSVKNMRPMVDYIAIIYQIENSLGAKCRPELLEVLARLEREQLTDAQYLYHPMRTNNRDGRDTNETTKRNIGLDMCRMAGMTYYMTMDCDEFYHQEQFEWAKPMAENYTATACPIVKYFKEPIWQFERLEEYFVPFICRLDRDTRHVHGAPFPVYVDPTRGVNCKDSFYLFKPEYLTMHHMTAVRRDRESYLFKLQNGSLGLAPESLAERNKGLMKEWDDFESSGHRGLDGQYHEVPNYWEVNFES